MKRVKITGTGTYLPGEKIPLDKVDQILGELTEAPTKIQKWLKMTKGLMRQLLEVEYYHFAIDPLSREFTEDNISMSVKAANKAIEAAGIKAEDIDFIAYGSPHQDQMPTTSVHIQEQLGIEQCGEIAIHANCTSAYKALLIAHDMLQMGRYKTALVISSNISSSELRAEYYNQEIVKKEEVLLRYFLSDGAGAMVLQATDDKKGLFVEHTYMESIGGKKPAAMFNQRPAYWMNPKEEFEKGYHHLNQLFNDQLSKHFNEEGGSVFYKGISRMLKKYPFKVDDIRFFQVNFPSKHISEVVMEECEKLGIPKEKLYAKMNTMGYIGPPMAIVSIDRMIREEQFNDGDLILSFVTEVSKFMQAGFLLRYES
jgi:3-oxoacyl-[acyl-carrier-protein] synthase III